ncbi:response regulator [Nocardiopsis xinjiangensis]|uniref:response regulator n=1 Tax=Nocardiopsis xinjiangensis TaxID=124285 RepID=UPI000362EDE8|nr:response regulator transcription factor [Nocardiopsis xinjiangensis]
MDSALERIRILVVDDHPMWCEAVARDLDEAGTTVVGTAGSGAKAMRIAPAARPTLAVVDLHLPDMGGVELIAGLTGLPEPPHVLVLSASGSGEDVLAAVKAGATGYLVKSADREQLLDAVRRVNAGEAVYTPGLAGLVLGEYRRLSSHAEPEEGAGTAPSLTPRETEVLRLVAKGLAYKQIAERLSISHRTVQNHVQNTLTKLHLHNRAQLVRYAIDQGIDGGGG